MTLRQITPPTITNLHPSDEPDRNGLEPGTHLASYPDAPPKGEPSDSTELLDDGASIMQLSDAVPAAQIDASTPYVLRDSYGRVLCVNGAGSGSWEWAYVGPYASYPKDVFPLHFSAAPTEGASLVAKTPSQNWPLHANGKATSWEWAFWASSTYSSSYPTMSLKATVAQSAPNQLDKYKLSWVNSGKTMYLCADSGTWNWLYVSSTHTPSQFTFHKFYVKKGKVDALFQKEWPNSSFVYSAFNTGDEYYQAISDSQAQAIYGASGLSNYTWKPEIFDCDDFSYVYKAQASKAAYTATTEYGYAVGVIFGSTKSGGHAVNVFIDPKGEVRIIEPQTGAIVAGKDWKDSQGVAYQPYFVLM